MLRLRTCLASHLLSFPSTPAISNLRHLISAAPPAISPNPGFAVEDYLVDSCGLTRAQALKASTKISHLKCRAKPDAVLAFLADLGLSGAAVAAVVSRDPKFLCAKVDKTLASNVAELTGLGLSRSEIAHLVPLAPSQFRSRSIVSDMQYYLPLFGSFGNLLRVLERGSYLVGTDLQKVCLPMPRTLIAKPEPVRAMAACPEGIGVPRSYPLFRQALQAVAFLNEEKIAAKVDYLKKTCRWSDAEVSIALAKAPLLLTRSKDILRLRSEFLISEVGLEPVYIAHRPAMLSYSMEGRLRPRYYVLKFLKENALVNQNQDYYNVVNKSEVVFMKKFICAHKEAAPHLADDYAATCKGEVPANFRFT